jgi:hypothetical protein
VSLESAGTTRSLLHPCTGSAHCHVFAERKSRDQVPPDTMPHFLGNVAAIGARPARMMG